MKEHGKTPSQSGYTGNGLPYLRLGRGPRTLVIFDGLDFSHKPPGGKMTSFVPNPIKTLAENRTVYEVRRRPGLPQGYSLKDMADDYADFIRQELSPPVDVMGLSTGGTIAQHFAADHPDLVRRLVLGMTGPCLLPRAKKWQLELARLAGEGRWRAAAATMADTMSPGLSAWMFRRLLWLMGKAVLGSPAYPDDGVAEILAEDQHEFHDRLKEIKCHALVIGGTEDFYYDIRSCAAGIPGSRLVLYENAGHLAIMKKDFCRDVLEFLEAD